MDDFAVMVILAGFLAQVIDGALGMGYGISSTSLLLSLGYPPVTASASVHFAEIFTTGVSGLSHLKLGNVDKSLLSRLLVPGVIGAVLGAYLLTSVPGKAIKPFIALYLVVMGALIVKKALKRQIQQKKVQDKVIGLGLIGGFFDAIGGGGWGPIVASNLVARGKKPRKAIGSANLAEFFVTLAASIAFLARVQPFQWKIIACLIAGGILAAPLAAVVCRKLPPRVLMLLVGCLVITLGLQTISQVILHWI